MIDLQDLRQRPDTYQDAAKKKNIKIDVSAFLKLDETRRALLQKVEEMRAEQNAVSKRVPAMKGAEKKTAIEEMKKLSDTLKAKEQELASIEECWSREQLIFPSIPLARAPVGKDEKGNVEVKRWGDAPRFDFTPKDHVQLGESLGLFDIPRGVKIGGSRSYFLTGDGARLHLAILRFTLDHLLKKGWRLFLPPLLAQSRFFMGTGFFPGAEEQIYTIGADNLSLIGTSEVSVMSYHADETLDATDLPTRYCGFSSCFRREAGTYGKDTHGLYRIHQFEKVEQVVLCEADETKALMLFEEIRTNAEEVLQALKLPYRVLDICTGDMGRGKVYMQDIETWMPSRGSAGLTTGAYGETHSCSYLGDFQTRRLNIKYKDANDRKFFAHSLNNTCIASPRILIPILEIYQNADGSVTIPEVLRPYMGGQERIGGKG